MFPGSRRSTAKVPFGSKSAGAAKAGATDQAIARPAVGPTPVVIFPFILTLFFLIIRPQDYPGLRGDFPLMQIVLGLCLAIYAFTFRGRLYWHPLLFFAAFCVAIVMSHATKGWVGGGVDSLIKFAPSAICMFLPMFAIRTARQFSIVLFFIAAFAAVLAIHGIFQKADGIGWTNLPLLDSRTIYVGIFADPNDLGSFYLFAIGAASYFGRSGGLGIRKVLSVIFIILLLWGIYLTNSRGAVVGLGVFGLVYAAVRFGGARSLMVLPILVAIMIALAPSRVTDASEDDAESSQSRIEAWATGLELVKKNPVFGTGFGTFVDYNTLTAHNSFVLTLAELGIVGYLGWFALIVTSFRAIYAFVRKKRTPPTGPPEVIQDAVRQANNERLMGVSYLAGFAGLIASSFFLSRSYFPILYIAFGMAFALVQIGHLVLDQKLSRYLVRSAAAGMISIVLLWLAVKFLNRN